MNQEEMRRYRSCDGVIWLVYYTPFWQFMTIWAGRLNRWVSDHASATATYKLLKGDVDDNPSQE